MNVNNSFIDDAMDAAEERIEATNEAKAQSDKAVEDLAAQKIIDDGNKPQPKGLRQRDDSGKYAKKAAPEPTVEVEETDLEDQTAETEETQDSAPVEPVADTSPVTPPVYWSAERKALFSKAPRELQEVIAARELETQQIISRHAHEADKSRSYEKRFYEDFESQDAANLHRTKLAAAGITDPISELHRYRAWDRLIEADAHTAISDLMQKNNFTPYDFVNDGSQPQNQYQDPRVDDAIQRAEAAEQRIKDFETKQQEGALAQTIEAFKSGKDAKGQERRQFIEMYAPQINQDIQSIQQNYPQVSFQDALNHAYEFRRTEVEKFHGITAAPQEIKPAKTREQLTAEAKAAELKAKNAASLTTGGPTTGHVTQKPRLKGKTFEEKLNSALDVAEERAYAGSH